VVAVEHNLVDSLIQSYCIDVQCKDSAADKGSNYMFVVGIDKDMAVDYEETAMHLFENIVVSRNSFALRIHC
jgi:hypothetical protein